MVFVDERDIESVAGRVAARYARKCWWRADKDELLQEARLACCTAAGSWDPEVGVPLDAYLYISAKRQVARWLLRDGAPVSAQWAKVGDLAGVRAISLEALGDRSDEVQRPDQAYDDKELAERIVDHLCGLWRANGVTYREQRLAFMSLAGGMTAREVADRVRVPVEVVCRARQKCRKLARRDLGCYRFWKEAK